MGTDRSGVHRLAGALVTISRPSSRAGWLVGAVDSVRIGQHPDTGVRTVLAVEVRDQDEELIPVSLVSDDFAAAALAATSLSGAVIGREVLVMFADVPVLVCLLQRNEG